jgi:hypothetical protein
LDIENSPRKQLLILGRNRKAKNKANDEITDTFNDLQTQKPDMAKNQILGSVVRDKQNDLVEAYNDDSSNAQSVPVKIADSEDQITQQQPNSEDVPEQNENSNQDKGFIGMGSSGSVSEAYQLEQSNSDKQIGSQAQAKTIPIAPRKKHAFIKLDPAQLAAELKAKK